MVSETRDESVVQIISALEVMEGALRSIKDAANKLLGEQDGDGDA